MKYRVYILRGIAVSHGQVGVLVGSLPKNGVLIKILMVVTPHYH